MVKNLPVSARDIKDMGPRVGKIPWSRARQSTSVFLPRIHGQRRQSGYSPEGHKELDMTETT